MSSEKVCKTIHQYNSEPIPEADMQKLLEIAGDYMKVKNYVYGRYGGIASLSKIYPGYTVQNEMTSSGYREVLGMPSVYFYLAVFDALGDIKCQWTRTKTKLLKLINQNEGFSDDDKHYLRFVLKVNNAFEAVLNQSEIHLPLDIRKKYEEVAAKVDPKRLNRYLCRQVRKYHVKLHTDQVLGFSLSERAYRYADGGIYISTREKRKRVFLPLTDNNQYKRQLRIRLFPAEKRVEIHIPVDVTIKKHKDYVNQIGVSMGYHTMLTTDQGHCYGVKLGAYQTEYADWMRTRSYNRNKGGNPGRKKYTSQKHRYTEQLHSYINHELNRFLETEKPGIIYVVKLPGPGKGGSSRRINHSMAERLYPQPAGPEMQRTVGGTF